MTPESFNIWLGIDVGKTDHWASAVNASGELVYSHLLPNDEGKLHQIYTDLSAKGNVVVVVGQPATIGALAVAVAQAMGIKVAYLPGLAMRRIAELYPGNAKTDQRDVFIIAQAGRTIPHRLRTRRALDQTEAELGMLSGFDDDLTRQITHTRSRIRGLYTQIHPGLERVIGPRLEHPAILAMLQTWPTPAALNKAGQARIGAKVKKHAARRWQAWANETIEALSTQTVTVTGTNAAKVVISHLAKTLDSLYHQRTDIETQIETLMTEHPLYLVLTSMPGIAVSTAAVIIAELADKDFPSAAHLASYAGLTPRTRQSGTSIKSQTAPHTGNKHLKRALFLSAFASQRSDPISGHYYNKNASQVNNTTKHS